MHDPDVLAVDLRWIEIWHREPHGADSGTHCRQSAWKWHIHHWRLNSMPLKALRRRLLTRCTWCGGRHSKGDSVNHSRDWYRDKTRWWRGEVGLYHSDCAVMDHAHRMCMCDMPILDNGDHGRCATCGKFRGWRQVPSDLEREMSAVPRGARMPQWIKNEFTARRRANEVSQLG